VSGLNGAGEGVSATGGEAKLGQGKSGKMSRIVQDARKMVRQVGRDLAKTPTVRGGVRRGNVGTMQSAGCEIEFGCLLMGELGGEKRRPDWGGEIKNADGSKD